MRLTTLGTSHGDPTYCRFNSSNLVESGGYSYLIDVGEPVAALLVRAKKDFNALKAVFITHMDDDHVDGITSLIKMLIKHSQAGNCTKIFMPEEIAIPPLEAWLKVLRIVWPSPVVLLKTVKPGLVYRDGVIEVEAVPTEHLRHPEHPVSFAYIVRSEGKTVVFTGDLRADFSDFPVCACDLCVCEATHYAPETAVPILKSAPIKRLIVSHIGNEWHGAGEADLRRWLAGLPYPAEIAHDGRAFEI